MTIPKTIIFRGKKYDLYDAVTTKAEADKKVKYIRKNNIGASGFGVRVKQIDDMWVIYWK